MGMKILELNINPPVATYNHHAFGTGIITTASWGMNWIYNNYIIPYFYPEEGPLAFDFYMDYIYCQPVFDREFLSDAMLKYIKEKPERIAADQLEAGKYVECCVNEYFIPGREAYRTYHFRHNILLYGYDSSKKIFYTAGYDESGRYTTSAITYREFRDSVPGAYNILKFREDLDCQLCPEHIQGQIMQYNGEAELIPVGAYTAKGKTIGIAAVNALMDYVQECIGQELPVDTRPIGILYTQRKLMKERLQYLNESGLAERSAVEAAKEQLNLCEMLKNRTLLYNMRSSGGDKAALRELTEDFRNLKLPNLG